MNTKILNTKILAAALGLLVAGGAVADASAATIVKTTRTVAHRTWKPVVAKKTVTIVHRAHRPHLVRVLPGHRLAPRVHLARAFATKRVVRTTVVR